MEEREALRRLKKQDEAGLEWFIDRYAAYVHTVIAGILGPSLTAVEGDALSSDVFFALWQSGKNLRGDNVRAWLASVARNKAKDHLAALGRELPLEDDPEVLDDTDVEQGVQQRELARQVNAALQTMEVPDREIFYRYYYYCQPVKAIAAAMGMNPSTIKTRLFRGRKQLRDVLTKGGFVCEAEDQ